MIAYARLTPGPGWQPMRALLYYLQRIIVARPVRSGIAVCIAATIRRLRPARMPQVDQTVAALRKDGCVTLAPLLSDDAIAAIVAYLERRDVILRDGTEVPVNRVPEGQPLADFPLATVINCPHVMELANHPRLIEAATAYLGCSPTISSMGLRWSFPAPAAAGVQLFHRDPDDWRIVKFFLYLTDVDEESGPHVFVRGSHHEAGQLFAQRYADADVMRQYGDALVTITGPRGLMFLADTSGIHKGAPPTRRPRLLLEVGFTLLPVFAFNYRPERLERAVPPFDRYINRLIVAA